MDIDLISPLPLEECQKRLDATLVHYSVQLPLWNWPPRKMAGSRSGFGFTLDPRAIQYYRARYGNYGPASVKMPFLGLLSESSSGTNIQGSFDTEAFQSSRATAAVVLFMITAGLYVMTGLALSQYNIQGFSWPFAICLIGICAVSTALSIYFWNQRNIRPNPPYKGKVKRFLELTLEAKEAPAQ
jgi:hypothetical protein